MTQVLYLSSKSFYSLDDHSAHWFRDWRRRKKENGKREKSVALLEERKEELEKESKQWESLQKKNQDLERKKSEHQQLIEIGNQILEEAKLRGIEE